MVVKMMKWRPWPPPVTKKYDVRIVVKKLEGFYSGVNSTTEKEGKIGKKLEGFCSSVESSTESEKIEEKGSKGFCSGVNGTAEAKKEKNGYLSGVENSRETEKEVKNVYKKIIEGFYLSVDNTTETGKNGCKEKLEGFYSGVDESRETEKDNKNGSIGFYSGVDESRETQKYGSKLEGFCSGVNSTTETEKGKDEFYSGVDESREREKEKCEWTVEIKWKGPKMVFRRRVKRERRVKYVEENSVVEWDEEFVGVCSLSGYKDSVFHPWDVGITVFRNGLNSGQKGKPAVVGTATINLAEFASKSEEKDFDLSIPLTSPSSAEPHPLLHISLSLVELRAAQESADPIQNKSTVPSTSPSPPSSVNALSSEKEDLSALKAGLRKVKILTEYVSIRRTKKAFPEEEDSEDTDYTYQYDSDSPGNDLDEEHSEEVKVGEQELSGVRKSFSYGSLAHANFAGSSYYSNVGINEEDEDWVYYSHRKSDVGCSKVEDFTASTSEPPFVFPSKRSILPWKKRKISFKSPKAKGEPLLNKANGEEGGDDIDFDRRQISSDESLGLGSHKADEDPNLNQMSISGFGDDNFAIGSWEHKEVTSRDGHMKLQTETFFASIDQRSERAAGESACTALVVVIANWFQNNRDLMPIKSQFDTLIREGSLEWRNLCEIETYRKRFPDKHFDLETILEAGIRPLSVVPEKSFVGFFHPEGMEEGSFDFLHGAMSFDNIWDEISRAGADCSPQVYIVSWNDHFFVLLVQSEAYYIIDTLGERLYEGCDQAYVLKFDTNTTISNVPNAVNSQEVAPVEREGPTEALVAEERDKVVCRGKESCKEYIKSFMAAIPIRELLADMKRGLAASMPLHHRLQIEFHYTRLLPPQQEIPEIEANPRE